MSTLQNMYEKTILAVGYSIGIVLFPCILLSSMRLIPTILLLVIYYAYFLRSKGKAQWPIKKLWITFWLVLFFVRVDISFINRPGPSRFMRYVIGLPAPATMRKAARGEVILGGCVATTLEPFWILVW